MVLGVVGTYKDHRSLAHTLQDSEHVARKLGLIIMAVILFILMVCYDLSLENAFVTLLEGCGWRRKSLRRSHGDIVVFES